MGEENELDALGRVAPGENPPSRPRESCLPRKACQGSSAPEAPALIAEPHGNLMHKPEAGVAPAAPSPGQTRERGRKRTDHEVSVGLPPPTPLAVSGDALS